MYRRRRLKIMFKRIFKGDKICSHCVSVNTQNWLKHFNFRIIILLIMWLCINFLCCNFDSKYLVICHNFLKVGVDELKALACIPKIAKYNTIWIYKGFVISNMKCELLWWVLNSNNCWYYHLYWIKVNTTLTDHSAAGFHQIDYFSVYR